MTKRDATDIWEAILDDLDIAPPSGSRGDEWIPVYQSFGERGFVRLTRHRSHAKMRLQLALPGCSISATRAAIIDWLATYDLKPSPSDKSGETAHEQNDSAAADDAVVLETALPDESNQDLRKDLVAIVESLRTAGDAIRSDDLSKLPDWLAAASDNDSPGTRASSTTNRDEPNSRLFEPIGANASKSGTSGSDQTQAHGDVHFDLAGYDTVSSRDTGTRLELNFESPVPSTAIDRFAEALAHSLRARFDVNATLETGDLAPGPTDAIVISVEPTASAPPDTDPAAATTEYLDRLIRFRKLGVPVAESIGLRDAPGESRPTNQSKQRRTNRRSDGQQSDVTDDSTGRRSAESEAGPDNEAPATEEASNEGITLGSASTSTDTTAATSSSETEDETTLEKTGDDAPTGPLKTGHFTDPRLMRDDATTSLVDVILRHPGYRDEQMAQVLSILLSLDYPDAKHLVNQAPTHLAWGVGRERAQRLKRVVEDTGGKVVFVEPDSIPS